MSLSVLYEKYCSKKTLDQLNDINHLANLIEDFLNDSQYLLQAQPASELKDCLISINPQDSQESLNNLISFHALRNIYYILADVWVDTLLAKVKGQELLGSWSDKLKLITQSDLKLQSFTNEHLVTTVISLAAAKINSAINFKQSPYKSVLDLNVDHLSFDILQQTHLAKYIAFLDHPNKEHINSIERQLVQQYEQVKLKRNILFSTSNCKIHFDEQGKLLVNSKPYNQAINSGYHSLTLQDAISMYKCELLKLELNDLTYKQLLLSDTNKALKKYTKEIIVVFNEPFGEKFNLSNFSVDELFKSCTTIVSLINHFHKANSKFKPMLQFNSNRPNQLALIFYY